eukprot:246996-Rhodomonas_salina.1
MLTGAAPLGTEDPMECLRLCASPARECAPLSVPRVHPSQDTVCTPQHSGQHARVCSSVPALHTDTYTDTDMDTQHTRVCTHRLDLDFPAPRPRARRAGGGTLGIAFAVSMGGGCPIPPPGPPIPPPGPPGPPGPPRPAPNIPAVVHEPMSGPP